MAKNNLRKEDPASFLYTDFYYIDRRGARREKRRYRRFKCRDAVAVFYNKKYGRIRDISLGGLSFSTIVTEAEYALENETGRKDSLEVIFRPEDLIIPELPMEIVHTHHWQETEPTTDHPFYRKQYGTCFRDLSTKQSFNIKSLILKASYL